MTSLRDSLITASVGENPPPQAISQRRKQLQERKAQLRDVHDSMSNEELLDRYAPLGIAPSEWPGLWFSTFDPEVLAELEKGRFERKKAYYEANYGAETATAKPMTPRQCVCGGTGFVTGNYAPGYGRFHEAVPCACTVAKHRGDMGKWLFANSGLQHIPDLAQKTIGSYDRRRSPQNREAFETAVAWGNGDVEWALFMGVSGTGKTHCAIAACQAVLLRKEPVHYITAGDFAAAARKAHEDPDIAEQMDYMRQVKHLALDDLGREHVTEFSIAALHQLLDHRTARHLPTLLVTNHTTEELLVIYGGESSKIAGWHPLISRMKQGRIGIFKGADQREGSRK